MRHPKQATILSVLFCLAPSPALQAATNTDKGFVAICKHVAGQRYDFGQLPEKRRPFTDEWAPETYADSTKFTFSFDGNELHTESGRANILYIGPEGQLIAYEFGPGALNHDAGNLYSFAIFPELGKVVMNRMQLVGGVMGNSVMGGTHELDCEFSPLSVRN